MLKPLPKRGPLKDMGQVMGHSAHYAGQMDFSSASQDVKAALMATAAQQYASTGLAGTNRFLESPIVPVNSGARLCQLIQQPDRVTMAVLPEFIEDLRQRVCRMSSAGVCRCAPFQWNMPFSFRKTPSFSVVDDDGFYHVWMRRMVMPFHFL